MPKFAVHMFEEVRRKFIIEAESVDAIKAMLDDDTLPCKFEPVDSEATGNYTKASCIDPLFEDGSVDYEKSQWVRVGP